MKYGCRFTRDAMRSGAVCGAAPLITAIGPISNEISSINHAQVLLLVPPDIDLYVSIEVFRSDRNHELRAPSNYTSAQSCPVQPPTSPPITKGPVRLFAFVRTDDGGAASRRCIVVLGFHRPRTRTCGIKTILLLTSPLTSKWTLSLN